MFTTGTFLDIAILWLIIVIFTESSDSDHSYRDTWNVVFGVALVGIVSDLVLGESLRLLAIPLQVAALYALVEWACGTEQKVTVKICGWYLAVGGATHLGLYYLTRPR